MSDPRPLIEEGASPFETELLEAGRRDAVSSRSRQRILTGLGIGGGLLAASTIASGVKATTAKGLLSTTTLGASVGAVGALAVWAGMTVLAPADEVPTASSKPSVAVLAPKRPAEAAPAPEPIAEAPAVAPAPLTPAVRAQAPQVAAPTSDSLALELAAIEEARNALGRKDYAHALRLLDDYARRFPKRRLNSEATVLRIETLSARGDRDAATRLGKNFLVSHPNGPYARRVRSLIGDPPTKTEL